MSRLNGWRRCGSADAAAFCGLSNRSSRSGHDNISVVPDRTHLPYGQRVPDTDALLRIAYDAAERGDFDHARRCYEQGAALGDFLCLHALGYMHDVGEGVPEDKVMAMKIYRKAWRRGSHASACNIAGLYRQQGRFNMMFRWYQRVAAAGDGSAHLEMAKCYLSGSGVRRSPEAALRCLIVAVRSQYISEYEREEAQALLTGLSPRLA